MKPQIAVIGSSNVDMIMTMAALPEKGETVTNAEFFQVFGGKGANQAVAAARAGGQVLFVNAVGNDATASRMLASFREDGLDLSCLEQFEDLPSGHALVMVGGEGMNYLSVAPGANARMTPEWLEPRVAAIRERPIWVVQCEIPVESLRYLMVEAKTPDNRILWNFAPAVPFEDPPLEACDLLVVNEVEAHQLTDITVKDQSGAREAAQSLRDRGVTEVIITLGVAGSYYLGPDAGASKVIPAYPVPAIDTTAAGDCYCGALAVALGEGLGMAEAIRFASAAAALSVQQLGAQPSLPQRKSIMQFLEEVGR